MKLTFKLFAFLLGVAFLSQSCVSNKAFQTARTTPEGDFGWGLGLSLPSGEYIDTTFAPFDTIKTGGFGLEIFGRYGLTEKIDVGVNLTLIGTGGMDVKYQFLGDESSDLAASIGAGFGYLSFGSDGANDSSYNVIDVTVPAYISYHPGDAFGLYASPRFTYRKFGDDSTTLLGGIAGLRIGGERSGLFIEYGLLTGGSDVFSNQSQINVGFGIGIR